MKKYVSLILSLVIVFSVAGCNRLKKTEKEQKVTQLESELPKLVDAKDVQYELIMNAFFFENNILKPNAALLILDKEEIKTDAEMFLSEIEWSHSCGYHYRILFWTNTDSLFGARSVNEECEVFGYKHKEASEKLAHYIKLLETAPTHYVYNLEIPLSVTPSEVREKLKDSKLNLFFINGEQTRFPSISFGYKNSRFVGRNASNKDWEKAEKENEEASIKKFKELVGKIKSISSVVSESDIFYSGMGRAWDSMYHKGGIELTFEIGTDLSNVTTLLKREGIIYNMNNPTTYLMQVVDTSADIKYIENNLKKYEFIKKITEYTREERE